MKNKILIYGAVLLGIIFIGLAIEYWVVPARNLPNYFPGFEQGSDKIHLKHGIASLVLGLGLFVYAWFESGKKN